MTWKLSTCCCACDICIKNIQNALMVMLSGICVGWVDGVQYQCEKNATVQVHVGVDFLIRKNLHSQPTQHTSHFASPSKPFVYSNYSHFIVLRHVFILYGKSFSSSYVNSECLLCTIILVIVEVRMRTLDQFFEIEILTYSDITSLHVSWCHVLEQKTLLRQSYRA